MDVDRVAAYSCGCDGYHSKPIDTRTFAARLRAAMNESKALSK